MRYTDHLSQTPAVYRAINTNKSFIKELILQKCLPLSPIPTGLEPDCEGRFNARAVLFDIYGTLLISGSGEVGSSTYDNNGVTVTPNFYRVLDECGIVVHVGPEEFNSLCHQRFLDYICNRHEQLKTQGVEFPEVDILSIWHRLLSELSLAGVIEVQMDAGILVKTALLFELSSNPTWLMPEASDVLRELGNEGHILGIISNAQFYTPLILETLFDRSLDELGFAADAMSWSYLHNFAKPSLDLFSSVLKNLHKRGIAPDKVIYVGNDMRNDVSTARRLGLGTVLFAGDRRSLRLRKGENHQLQTCTPDAIITELRDLLHIVFYDHADAKE